MKKLFFLSCLLIGLFGCENKEAGKQKIANAVLLKQSAVPKEQAFDKAGSGSEEKAPANNAQANQTIKEVSRKVIREGEIRFETANIAETRKAIYNSLQKFGGYIAEEEQTADSSNTRKEYVIKARIPENNFEKFLDGVSSGAIKVDSKHISSKDVTADFIDYSTQIANKKKLEDRYVELLKKGSKMADLLEIEDKITEIQTDIETTQGQLNYLVKQVAYSSLDITFYTIPPVNDNHQTFGLKLIAALSSGWDIFVELFFDVVSVWPLWIVIAMGYFTFKAWHKKQPAVKVGPLAK